MADQIVKGTPPMLMLPAKNYFFKVHEEKHRLSIPRVGKFQDLDPEFYTEDSGEFKIFDPETGHFHISAIGQVLFAQKQYPDLGPNQLFVPFSMVVTDEEIHILGQIIEIVVPVEKPEEPKEEEIH